MKKFLSIGIVLLLAVILVGCGKKEDKKVDFMDEYEADGLVFKNESLSASGESTIITSTLTNNSDEDRSISWVKLTVTYKNTSDNEYTTDMLIYFGDKIEGHQTLQTTTTIDFDINTITDVKYEFAQKG